jgi:hypothetical protein
LPATSYESGGGKLLTGKAAMGDWTNDAPGVLARSPLGIEVSYIGK